MVSSTNSSMRISIVICNYNYGAFLEAAIRSAVEQDYADTEVLVVDDGSTDDSRSILERWRNRVSVLYKDNGGQISAYNAGFERITGDVVIFLDSDDLLDRNACSAVVAAFEPQVAKVHFRLRLIDSAGAPLGACIPTRLAEGDLADRLLVHGELYDSSPGSGNAYRVSALRRLMPMLADSRDRHGADFFAILGTSLLGTVRTAHRGPLGSYRVHRPEQTQALAFGNASPDPEEPARAYRRYGRARLWLAERLGADCILPAPAPIFSLEKSRYALAIFSARTYVDGLRAGGKLLSESVARYVCNPGNR